MRWLALLFLFCSPAVVAAPEASPRATSRKKPKAPPREASPESSSAGPSRTGNRQAATKPAEEMRHALALAGGGFHGGGFNRGPQGLAQLTLMPPGWGRFSLDVELGWRLARFRTAEGVSALHSLPLLAAGRLNLVRMAHFGVDVRVGVGPLLALHHLTSNVSANSVRSSLGWELIAGAQLRFPLGALEPFLDGRVGLGEAYIPFVLGRSTVVQGLVGVRYQLP